MARNTLEAWIPEEWDSSRVIQSISRCPPSRPSPPASPWAPTPSTSPAPPGWASTSSPRAAPTARTPPQRRSPPVRDQVRQGRAHRRRGHRRLGGQRHRGEDDRLGQVLRQDDRQRLPRRVRRVQRHHGPVHQPLPAAEHHGRHPQLHRRREHHHRRVLRRPDLRRVLHRHRQRRSGDYFDPGSMVAIAHPAFRKSLRGVVDGQSRPIFNENGAGTPDTIFNVPVRWSLGAKSPRPPPRPDRPSDHGVRQPGAHAPRRPLRPRVRVHRRTRRPVRAHRRVDPQDARPPRLGLRPPERRQPSSSADHP
jgi:hypothetical protein